MGPGVRRIEVQALVKDVVTHELDVETVVVTEGVRAAVVNLVVLIIQTITDPGEYTAKSML